ncbi:MAG: bis-aminopropyl spermidine synthase family protein [bacterium]|nr:bis-aminopropyl spermidine synthase family protein [bacterium]
MISDLRPQPKRKLDQFGVTEETLEARAQFLSKRGFLSAAKILFLGDFDLTSLACLHLIKNSELWVLDSDEEVLDVIKKEGKGALQTIHHNLVSPLPKKLHASFDYVFTDPPYTPQGVGLFVSRALEALTLGARARIIFSYGSLDPVRVLAVQQVILSQGLVIEEILKGFNQYTSAKTIGDTSDLYVLAPTAKTKPSVRGDYQDKIYTWE